MKTLVVDDDFTNRLILQAILQPYGEVHIAASGDEAIEAVHMAVEKKDQYDLICLDIMMPGMDGHAALGSIRDIEECNGIQLGKGAKVIMTTGLNDPKHFFSAFRGQCDYYLTKPIDAAKLTSYLKDSKLIN